MVIEENLAVIGAMLKDAEESPHVRELRAKARSYERIVRQWSTVPPSDAQRDATLDLVNELRTKTAEATKAAPPSTRERQPKS